MEQKKYELIAETRGNGSIYITGETLPGFHYILWPGDDIEATLLPAFAEFLAMYEAARIRDVRQRRLKLHPRSRGYTAELEVA